MKKLPATFLAVLAAAHLAAADDARKTVEFSTVPAAVQKTVRAQIGDAKMGAITREVEDGEVSYDVEMSGKDGVHRGFTVDEDGTLTSMEVALAEAPAAVQKTVNEQVGAGRLKSIDRNFDDEGISYDIEMTEKDGRERGFTVEEDGTLSSIEVVLFETPAQVQKTIIEQIGQGTIVSIEKTFDDGEVTYEVDMKTKGGEEREFTVEENGSLSSIEVALSETPAAVQKTVNAQIGGGTLDGIMKIIEDQGVNYEVDMTTADGREREFTVGSGGKLLSIEISLEEATPEAQKTIREYIGAAKILRVVKSFEFKKKVLPYEVEAMKDGKPYDFSVGPHGRFLGMDD